MQPSEQNRPVSGSLPNRPDSKLPAIPRGTRVSKRPLGHRLPVRPAPRSSARSRPSEESTSRDARIIYISTSTPFMSVVKRALKTLEKAPSRRKGMPLKARIEAVGKGDGGSSAKGGKELKDDVLIVGTGRAIDKTLSVAAWLTRREDLKVSLRTRSVGTVDDVVPVRRKLAEGEEEEEDVGEEAGGPEMEESARVRWLSCLEVGVCMR